MNAVELKTPLFDAHVALGARMVPFAGYAMPVQYNGVIAETQAVRAGAGMFDVSHMARLQFHGEKTLAFLEWVTSNDVAELSDSCGHYSLLPNDRGGLVDDIIVYRLDANNFRMVVNASNHAKDVAWLKQNNTFNVEIEDHTDGTAMIAVQGPKATEIIAGLAEYPDAFRNAPMFGVVHSEVAGIPTFAARSGYTGEDGYELICKAESAEALWNALHQAGVAPCGLGSRDVLRVEAGLPLYGHELGDDLSPVAAGLSWVIGKEKPFIGSSHIREAQIKGTDTKLVGVRLDGKRLPMPEMAVCVDGRQVGSVCSGVYSPILECGLAFAFVETGIALKTPCTIDMRGKAEPGMIVSKRFWKREKPV